MGISRVIDRDKGYKSFKKRVSKIGGQSVKVGIDADAEYPNGVPVALVAAVHEFGSDTVPARAPIRKAAERGRVSTLLLVNKLIGAVIDGRLTVEQALERAGTFERDLIRKEIVRQGLVDTGRLVRSVDFEVTK